MNWAAQELATINLGDKRLNERAFLLATKLSQQSTESIPRACGGWQETKAAYRFFANKRVTSKKILAPHKEATLKRINAQDTVLLVQDTTELNYSGQKQKQGVGNSHSEKDLTLHLHPLLAVTPEKCCLGIVDDYSWHRTALHRKTKTKQQVNTYNMHAPIEEKESLRWLAGYRKACAIAEQCPDTQIVCVGDRESDIFDIYHDEEQRGDQCKADWLIRAKLNRALMDEHGKRKITLLFEDMQATDVAGTFYLNLPKRNGKAARHAHVHVKIKRLTLHPPTGRRGVLRLASVNVTAIQVIETNPPSQVEPIEWLLLTSVEGDSFADALTFINWYTCRWQIEIFFKTVKSGCNIEALQLTEPERFLPCITLYLIIAWRILFLTTIGRVTPEQSCSDYFEEVEWKMAYSAVHRKPPTITPTLSEAISLVAQLGGYLARRHDGPPGVKTLWLGLRKLADMVSAYELAKKISF